MRAVQATLKELVLHVSPPRGCAIVLTELKSGGPTDPNWVAACGIMEAQPLNRFNGRSLSCGGRTRRSTGLTSRFLSAGTAA
jgi:hypothetical protein